MNVRVAAAALVLLSSVAAPAQGPVLSRTNEELAEVSAVSDLLVFKGMTLLNEFVYRTVVHLPEGAQATPQTAKLVVQQIATFLGDAGYDLAKVRAQVKDGRIEVQIDEGALDKIIVVGGGWITALRFRNRLDLPLDIFNRRAFEQQLPKLAKDFGFRTYRYELWPVQLLDADNARTLDPEELRAMPLLRPARGYELRVFGQGEAWGTGFSPEVLLNGAIGYGIGGRYRWKDIFQDGDRGQVHFRVGAASRGSLDPDGSSSWVNSESYVSARWLSKGWDGSPTGLRMTIAPHFDLWDLQRADLMLQSFRVGTLELGTGAGAQLTREFSLYVTFGLQRMWLFDVEPGTTAGVAATLPGDVTKVPSVSNRGFLRATSQYVFNVEELRTDHRNTVSLTLDAFQPTVSGTSGYFHLDFSGYKFIGIGWHEVRLTLLTAAEAGNVLFTDETPLSSQLRIGFGVSKWTQRISTLSFEFRYSLLRDKIKVGVYNDLAVWRQLARVDPSEAFELAGSSGGGLFFFVLDELQIDAFYGMGWATDGYHAPGFSLSINQVF
jgi:hypothetical protein